VPTTMPLRLPLPILLVRAVVATILFPTAVAAATAAAAATTTPALSSAFVLPVASPKKKQPAAAAAALAKKKVMMMATTTTPPEMSPWSDYQQQPQQQDEEFGVFEVVGGSGRIGGVLMRSGGGRARPVPRGVAPGSCWTNCGGSPILVATPSEAWHRIYLETVPEHRRRDLVYVGNGLPREWQRNATLVVPHFAVLSTSTSSEDGEEENVDGTGGQGCGGGGGGSKKGKLETSDTSPPTYVYGKHGRFVASALRRSGLPSSNLRFVQEWNTVAALAARKLLWASTMWLLCHSTVTANYDDVGQPPLTVSQVHDQRQPLLVQLVRELLPAVRRVVRSIANSNGTATDNDDKDGDREAEQLLQLDDVLAYLEAYSRSVPRAIPSLRLAVSEIADRNLVWLPEEANEDDRTEQPYGATGLRAQQPLHCKLLEQVTGISIEELLQKLTNAEQPTGSCLRTSVRLPEQDLTLWGYRKAQQPSRSLTNVVIIGGGIIGTSVALHLARYGRDNDSNGIKVTVVDRLPPSRASPAAMSSHGLTTPASWAWLNANDKSPMQYQWLNLLGMRGWRTDPVYLDDCAPTFCGSLVRYRAAPDFFGGYKAEGPLSQERILELEPQSNCSYNLQSNGSWPVYYFGEDGLVDPAEAVERLRRSAEQLGVNFLEGRNVTNFIRDENGQVVEVCTVPSVGELSGVAIDETPTETLLADVVVVAAGVGAGEDTLGSLPLAPNMGQVAFAKSSSSSEVRTNLTRILVDTVRQSHVLQRRDRDGTFVAGGGFLEVGGSTSVSSRSVSNSGSSSTSFEEGDESLVMKGKELLSAARELAPGAVGVTEYAGTAQAVRPIPKDGLPAVGYYSEDEAPSSASSNVYYVVTHSGVTLAPILGAAAAAEIVRGVSLDLLEPYRPRRLFARNVQDADGDYHEPE